jgi:hypothetical protein
MTDTPGADHVPLADKIPSAFTGNAQKGGQVFADTRFFCDEQGHPHWYFSSVSSVTPKKVGAIVVVFPILFGRKNQNTLAITPTFFSQTGLI